MSNIIDLSAFKSAHAPERDTHSENEGTIERRWISRRRGGHRSFVFRSYNLIVLAEESELVRDVRLDTDKAKTKLRKIREQIVIDRDKAAARAEMMSKAEAKLSAAIEAAAAQTPDQPAGQIRSGAAPSLQ